MFNPSSGEQALIDAGLDSEEAIRGLRYRAKTDLYFLATGILGFDGLNQTLHKHLCEWHQAFLDYQYRLILLPRSHYKSTIMTITDVVQICLPDPFFGTENQQPHPRNLGSNCKTLIIHEVRDKAAEFLGTITNHFFSNPILTALFPELVPDERIHRVNRYELELPRTAFWKEPTVAAMGIESRNQGDHYHFIKADDIYGTEAAESKAKHDSTIRRVNEIQAFLVTPLEDHIDFIGTRKPSPWEIPEARTGGDVYVHIMNTYESQLIQYVRAVEEFNPVTHRKEAIFPEKFGITKDGRNPLDILRKDPRVFNADYLNNPLEGATKFDEQWLRYFEVEGLGLKYADLFGTYRVSPRNLHKIMLIDPAMSGDAGWVITGTGEKDKIFILESDRRPYRPSELVDLIFQKVLLHNLDLVVLEYVLFSEVFETLLMREMQFRNVRFRLEGARTKNQAKEARIEGLEAYFKSGQIYFHRSQGELIREYKMFGGSGDIHALDALAYGPKFWKFGFRRATELEKVNSLPAKRDFLTGYSPYEDEED